MFKKILLCTIALVFAASTVWAGTVTIESQKHTTWGNKRISMGEVLFYGLYPTNGFPVTPHAIGLNVIEKIIFISSGAAETMDDTRYDLSWVQETNTIRFYARSNNTARPTRTIASSDTFKVTSIHMTAPDADTADVFVSSMGGGLARFTCPGVNAFTAGDATNWRLGPIFSASDSASCGVVSDTVLSMSGSLRTVYHGVDTVYFDYNGTNRTTKRLMYSGTNLGNQGDLYIPFGAMNFIRVAKKTSLEIYTAGAKPMCYIRDNGYDDKFVVDMVGYAPVSSFACDSTYTPIAAFRTENTELSTTQSVAAYYFFIAIGN